MAPPSQHTPVPVAVASLAELFANASDSPVKVHAGCARRDANACGLSCVRWPSLQESSQSSLVDMFAAASLSSEIPEVAALRWSSHLLDHLLAAQPSTALKAIVADLHEVAEEHEADLAEPTPPAARTMARRASVPMAPPLAPPVAPPVVLPGAACVCVCSAADSAAAGAARAAAHVPGLGRERREQRERLCRRATACCSAQDHFRPRVAPEAQRRHQHGSPHGSGQPPFGQAQDAHAHCEAATDGDGALPLTAVFVQTYTRNIPNADSMSFAELVRTSAKIKLRDTGVPRCVCSVPTPPRKLTERRCLQLPRRYPRPAAPEDQLRGGALSSLQGSDRAGPRARVRPLA
jgi:hypothetical protein